jgi:hypothetical protein
MAQPDLRAESREEVPEWDQPLPCPHRLLAVLLPRSQVMRCQRTEAVDSHKRSDFDNGSVYNVIDQCGRGASSQKLTQNRLQKGQEIVIVGIGGFEHFACGPNPKKNTDLKGHLAPHFLSPRLGTGVRSLPLLNPCVYANASGGYF